jgi:hypothetical protein
MTKIRYRDLTQKQKDFVCSGCGPKGLFVKPPNFRFRASCDHHDFNYWLGCHRYHRKKADLQFYCEMLKDAGGKRKYKFWAQAYYRAVRIGGIPFFNWAKRQRTLEDLEAAMESEGLI